VEVRAVAAVAVTAVAHAVSPEDEHKII
jgi:hypothetical protein